ncbi:phosphatase PAP2 family protein [Psychroserpens sp.]
MKNLILVIALLTITFKINGQTIEVDTLQQKKSTQFNYKSLIAPVSLITIGALGIKSDSFKSFNSEISEEIEEHIDEKFTIDDITQYAPALSVYALNAVGIKGKNNFRDRTIILGIAYLINRPVVSGLKDLVEVKRPDGSINPDSWPSGHTALSFMGAEFLYQEYKDVSIWYGISGYIVASGTGFFRMYNNRHWLSDVLAGAGVGILSTKIAYWVYPFIKRSIFKGKNDRIVMPFYNGKEYGLSLSVLF